jgi:hypothetical protein
MGQLQLIIIKQPSEYAFPGEWLEIEMALEQSEDFNKKTIKILDDVILQSCISFRDGNVSMEKSCELSLAKLVSKIKCSFWPSVLIFFSLSTYESFPPSGHGPICTAE